MKKMNETKNILKRILVALLICATPLGLYGCLNNGTDTDSSATKENTKTEQKSNEDKESKDKSSDDKGAKNNDSGKAEDSKSSDSASKTDTQSKDDVSEESQSKSGFEAATVLRVVDGDTLKVSMKGREYKLRMIGVDTPETVHPTKGVQFYGKEASNYTKKMLTGKVVYLQRDVSDTDKYGRLLRYVWIKNPPTSNPQVDIIKGSMFNAMLVMGGYARAIEYKPDTRYSDLFAILQKQAQDASKGMWAANYNYKKDATGDKNRGSNDNVADSGKHKDYTPDRRQGVIKGNKRTKIYHVPGGKAYNKISEKNVVYFNSEEEAKANGYRRAQN